MVEREYVDCEICDEYTESLQKIVTHVIKLLKQSRLDEKPYCEEERFRTKSS